MSRILISTSKWTIFCEDGSTHLNIFSLFMFLKGFTYIMFTLNLMYITPLALNKRIVCCKLSKHIVLVCSHTSF